MDYNKKSKKGVRVSEKIYNLLTILCLTLFVAVIAWCLSPSYFGSCQQRTPIEIPRCENGK